MVKQEQKQEEQQEAPLEKGLLRTEVREFTYKCPKRGLVTEKIEVKIYETGGKPVVQVCH